MTAKLSRYVREAEKQKNEKERRQLVAARARFRLGSELLMQRRKVGMTQQQLSNASGIAQGDISRIEHGLANPAAATLDAIGRPLGVTLEFVEDKTTKKAAEA